MKNAMKKLMSLVLVAILLVSAVPFAASAASIPVEIYQAVDGVDEVIATSTASLSIAAICEENGIGTGEFDGAWVTNNDKEYKKNYDDTFGDTSTLVKIRKKAIVTTVTCNNCGEVYKIADGHTCPAPDPVTPITIVIKADESDTPIFTGTKVPANGEYALVENLLSYCWNSSWDNVYEFSHSWVSGKGTNANKDAKIYAGEEVHIRLLTKETKETTTPTETTTSNGVNSYYGDEAMKDIWLYIYTNTNMTTPATRVLLNNYTIVSDGTVNKSEILTVVDDYYYATDSNTGIVWKGMYLESATDLATNLQFVQGDLYDELNGLKESRYNDVTIIMARVTGVTAKSTSTADSSNPKTGDMIFAPIAVLGLSASALAVMFFLNKKRAV